MRPRLNRATRSVGWLSTAWRYSASASSSLPAALENLSEVVVRLRVQRIQRERLAVGVCRLVPVLLHAEQDAVVVVGIRQVDAERDDRFVVLLGLRPVALRP